MKKIILTLTIAYTIAGTVSAIGSDPTNDPNENSSVNISYGEGKKIKLTVLDADKGAVDLTVVDKKSGKKIADYVHNYSKSFALPIDMTKEKDGQYEVIVKGKDFEWKQDVFLSSMSEDDVYASIEKSDDGKINVKVFHENVPVKLKIEDAEGKIYHRYVHLNSSNFQKSIDLGNLTSNKELFISISGIKTSIYQAL